MTKTKFQIKERLDFDHYFPIISDEENWKNIFSEIFPEKDNLKENLEQLKKFNTKLNQNVASLEELREYPRYIYSITNCFTKDYNVFLSYSTKDSKHFNIAKIANRLEEYSEINKVFYWELDSGEKIVKYMERGLEICQIFVLLCSSNAEKSKAVESEWQTAYQLSQANKIKIVPVHENHKFVPNMLLPFLRVEYKIEDFDQFIDELHKGITRKKSA